MWRSFVLAFSICLLIVGAEFLVVEKTTLARPVDVERQSGFFSSFDPNDLRNREFKPADWVPWACLASGTIALLYSLTLPKPE